LSSPHPTIAVGDLALNHGGTQRSLTGVVGGLNQPRIIQEGQGLPAGAANLGLRSRASDG
jgi:hypothetical protein